MKQKTSFSKGTKQKRIVLLLIAIICSASIKAQSIESVTFSSVASNDDNFQPVMGTPYGASLSGANGSLEISASYGEGTYEESMLSTEELKLQSSIRVFPNPTTYLVNIDLSQLPQGKYELFLVDFSGKTIYNQTTQATSEQLDMSSYATGSYVLKVQTTKTKKLETFKIIKK